MSVEDEIDHVVSRPSHLIKFLGDQYAVVFDISKIGLCRLADSHARRTKLPQQSARTWSADGLVLMVS